ncbi:hypothetical protein [Kosakonia cowanii]|uniref:hypothetical protein n=1 Tax=Kosakonia cowanii TaxID=208223 RepID=UPI0039A6BCFB
MQRWLAKILGKQGAAEQDAPFPLPWPGDRQSIYHFIAPYADGNAPLPEQAQTLPDEDTLEGELRWVAGGMDGAFGHHGGGADAEEAADEILSALSAVLRKPSPANMNTFYALLKARPPLDYIDILTDKLPEAPSLSPQQVHDLMVWLATNSPDRNPVKCAIALLAFFPSDENRALVTTLGLHEEFTLFTAVALRNMLPEEAFDATLTALAKRVTGWGRIQLIERLPDEVSPATREWLLRDGYANSVMEEYTAWDCATKGRLLAALSVDAVDDGVLTGAGDILAALIAGGPARDIHDYPEGAQACHRYLTLLRRSKNDDLRNLLNTSAIGAFASDEDNNWETLQVEGWSDEIRQQIADDVEAIVAQEKWLTRVQQDLTACDNGDFYLALRAAKLLGIDTWEQVFARQQTVPNEANWYELMQTESPQRMERILQLAEQQLDLAAIASGPDTLMGLGAEYRQHGALDFILQDLNRFPGMGWSLIKTGLRSPVVRNRLMALNALEGWPEEQLPAELHGMLETAFHAEPDDNVRARLEKMLAEE